MLAVWPTTRPPESRSRRTPAVLSPKLVTSTSTTLAANAASVEFECLQSAAAPASFRARSHRSARLPAIIPRPRHRIAALASACRKTAASRVPATSTTAMAPSAPIARML
eukprot:Amastigsp_a841299_26.p2 type:complete len:110 gc:universal Amastigsp_a841299_26:242-571(+)